MVNGDFFATMNYPKKNRFQSVPIAALRLYNIQRENLVFKKSLCSIHGNWEGLRPYLYKIHILMFQNILHLFSLSTKISNFCCAYYSLILCISYTLLSNIALSYVVSQYILSTLPLIFLFLYYPTWRASSRTM